MSEQKLLRIIVESGLSYCHQGRFITQWYVALRRLCDVILTLLFQVEYTLELTDTGRKQQQQQQQPIYQDNSGYRYSLEKQWLHYSHSLYLISKYQMRLILKWN
jgi:hypothetical protein